MGGAVSNQHIEDHRVEKPEPNGNIFSLLERIGAECAGAVSVLPPGEETIAGLRARAEEVGLPYQTLAASVLHMVAKGELKLALSRAV